MKSQEIIRSLVNRYRFHLESANFKKATAVLEDIRNQVSLGNDDVGPLLFDSDPYVKYCIAVATKDVFPSESYKSLLEISQLSIPFISQHAQLELLMRDPSYASRVAKVINSRSSKIKPITLKDIRATLRGCGLSRLLPVIESLAIPSYRLELSRGRGKAHSRLYGYVAKECQLYRALGNDSSDWLKLCALIDLHELPETETRLPRDGCLCLFAEPSRDPGPDGMSDYHKLVFYSGSNAPFSSKTRSQDQGLVIKFIKHLSIPPDTDQIDGIFQNDDERQLYANAIETLREKSGDITLPVHRLFGYADRLQGWDDPNLFNSIDGDIGNYKLILQLDSMEEFPEFSWGGGSDGRLFVWMTEEDLAQRRFEQARFSIEFT